MRGFFLYDTVSKDESFFSYVVVNNYFLVMIQ